MSAQALGERFRSLLGSRPGAGAAKAGGPRIGVIGNCQASAIAQSMALLLPHARVTYRSVYRIERAYRGVEDLAAAFRDCDAVFSMPYPIPFRDGRTLGDLKAERPVIEIPIIAFAAFHPDLVYIDDRAPKAGPRHVHGAIGPYNSALALYGYMAGFSVDETLRLFNREAFEALTYLSMWDLSLPHLLAAGAGAGYDLSESVMRWSRRGAFMHSVNHPKMFVMCDIARGLLGKAGFGFAEIDLESLAMDEMLREGTYPVYPEIAELYGVKGGYAFVSRSRRTLEILANLTLRDFVEGSFRSYESVGRERLGCTRVEGWLADEALKPAFRAWAGRR